MQSNLERAFDSAAKDVGHAFTNVVSSSIVSIHTYIHT